MKSSILSLLTVFLCCPSFAQYSDKNWADLDKDTQSEILFDIDYMSDEDLPKDVKLVVYANYKMPKFNIDDVQNINHRAYIKKILYAFDKDVSREDIEQSPYQAYGDEEITGLYLIVNQQNEVLAGTLSAYQDGRDEDDNEGDINWSVLVRFDDTGEFFKDENGQTVDELYFEWSGH